MAGGAFTNAFGRGFDRTYFSGSAVVTIAASAVISAVGSLVGTTGLVISATGNLTAIGALSGTANIFHSVSAIPSGHIKSVVVLAGTFRDTTVLTGVFVDSKGLRGTC